MDRSVSSSVLAFEISRSHASCWDSRIPTTFGCPLSFLKGSVYGWKTSNSRGAIVYKNRSAEEMEWEEKTRTNNLSLAPLQSQLLHQEICEYAATYSFSCCLPAALLAALLAAFPRLQTVLAPCQAAFPLRLLIPLSPSLVPASNQLFRCFA
jgi:hypothetical protein